MVGVPCSASTASSGRVPPSRTKAGGDATRALERSRGQLQRRLAGIEQGGVGEVELDRDLGTVRRRGPQQPLDLRPDLRCALPRRQPHAQLRAGHRRDHRARLAAREHVHVNGRLGAGALPELLGRAGA